MKNKPRQFPYSSVIENQSISTNIIDEILHLQKKNNFNNLH